MRVLWFTNSPCGYNVNGGYNGGGWLLSLQSKIVKQTDIILAISFCMDGQPEKVEQGETIYYPVSSHVKGTKDKIIDIIRYNDVTRDEILWHHYINHFKRVIDDFKPDVVEVFGSELYTGLGAIAAKKLNIPCVLHLQGILSAIMHAFLPPRVSEWSFCFSEGIKNAYSKFQLLTYWKRSCHREKAILKAVNYVIGRTEWDKNALEVLNPDAKYHWGGEILRSCFYEDSDRNIPEKVVITTTSSNASYKGFDLILKVANILKNECGLDFEWNVYGNVSPKFFERVTGVRHDKVNINLKGVASAEQLRDAMLNSTLYFQPSYVENSPNSVAEAQVLGLPVVATNVGGTCSMVEHGKSGYLFPATDPYMAAYYIMKTVKNTSFNVDMGKYGQNIARQRHARETIVQSLKKIYKTVIVDAK